MAASATDSDAGDDEVGGDEAEQDEDEQLAAPAVRALLEQADAALAVRRPADDVPVDRQRRQQRDEDDADGRDGARAMRICSTAMDGR